MVPSGQLAYGSTPHDPIDQSASSICSGQHYSRICPCPSQAYQDHLHSLLDSPIRVITSSSSSGHYTACNKAQSTSLSTLRRVFRNKVYINPTLIHVSSLMVIAITYIDDLLFYTRDDNSINLLIVALKANDIWICREGTAEGFLGVDISCTYASLGSNPTVTLKQKGTGLCTSYTTKLDTPAERSPLSRDINGAPALGSFNYAAVIGMLLYLSVHSCPAIAFTVHQCARYTFAPTAFHK
ncbi:LOW QUALITY PROTEIN: hypothetical protein ACHAW6_003788 [Cyclotella cf. meneghiniana]